MLDEDLLSEANRRAISQRLRRIADNLENSRITPDSYSLDAEWIGTSCTGRVFLKFSFWARPIPIPECQP